MLIDLAGNIKIMQGLVREEQVTGLEASLHELSDKIKRETLYIVVVGLFKRGKSSLINAVLEKELLPVAVTPLTAIITILEYTDNPPYIEVSFEDGRIEIKSTADIHLYVSEEANPVNEKRVGLVRVFDDSPLLKTISLVDTPGLDSAFEHNTKTTLQFVPKIDAALFVLSADVPISKTELDFLRELKALVPKIIFAINKIDLLNEDDLKKVTMHDVKILGSLLERNSEEILQVSAHRSKQGSAASGLTQLRQIIADIGKNEKSTLIEASAQRQYRSLHNDLRLQLQLKLEALNTPVDELEQKLWQMRQSVFVMRKQKDEFENIIRGKVRSIDEQIRLITTEEANQVKEIVSNRLNGKLDGSLHKTDLTSAQVELNQLILDRFELVKKKLEDVTKEEFRELLSEYRNRSLSFLNQLAEQMNSLLGVSFDMIADQFDLDVYTSFYLTLDSNLGNVILNPSVFDQLFPASFRQKRLLSRLNKHYQEVIIRNTASVAYNLQYRVQESFRKFDYDLNSRLKELLDRLEAVLSNTLELKENTELSLQEAVKLVKEKLELLDSIQLPAKSK